MRKVIVVAIAIGVAEVVGALAYTLLPWWLAWPLLAVAGYAIVDNAMQQYHS